MEHFVSFSFKSYELRGSTRFWQNKFVYWWQLNLNSLRIIEEEIYFVHGSFLVCRDSFWLNEENQIFTNFLKKILMQKWVFILEKTKTVSESLLNGITVARIFISNFSTISTLITEVSILVSVFSASIRQREIKWPNCRYHFLSAWSKNYILSS